MACVEKRAGREAGMARRFLGCSLCCPVRQFGSAVCGRVGQLIRGLPAVIQKHCSVLGSAVLSEAAVVGSAATQRKARAQEAPSHSRAVGLRARRRFPGHLGEGATA